MDHMTYKITSVALDEVKTMNGIIEMVIVTMMMTTTTTMMMEVMLNVVN